MQGTEISSEMRQRFELCAPAALKRRSPAYLRSLVFNCVQMPVLGAIGLAGLYLWHWSPLTLYAMLLAGMGANILVCTLRWLAARQALFALWSWRRPDDAVLDGFGAGLHGVTMLVFAAILAFGIDSMDALRKLMVGLNVTVIVFGVFALFGCRLMRQQVDWLRAYLMRRARGMNIETPAVRP